MIVSERSQLQVDRKNTRLEGFIDSTEITRSSVIIASTHFDRKNTRLEGFIDSTEITRSSVIIASTHLL